MSLQTRFEHLCESLGVEKGVAQQWWQKISEHCQEKQRFYHTLQHLNNLYKVFEKNKEKLKVLPKNEYIIALCIFFHEYLNYKIISNNASVIYEPTRGDNEDKSAEIFLDFAKNTNLSQTDIDYVKKIILATKNHMSHRDLAEDENWLLFVFLDLDLSILGAPQEEYIEYAKAIRQEYIHVDDETFRRERGAFLKRWLARGQEGLYLYYTTPMRELFEAAAARNLQFEQEKLSVGLM